MTRTDATVRDCRTAVAITPPRLTRTRRRFTANASDLPGGFGYRPAAARLLGPTGIGYEVRHTEGVMEVADSVPSGDYELIMVFGSDPRTLYLAGNINISE